jgi:hypothetical protein
MQLLKKEKGVSEAQGQEDIAGNMVDKNSPR